MLWYCMPTNVAGCYAGVNCQVYLRNTPSVMSIPSPKTLWSYYATNYGILVNFILCDIIVINTRGQVFTEQCTAVGVSRHVIETDLYTVWWLIWVLHTFVVIYMSSVVKDTEIHICGDWYRLMCVMIDTELYTFVFDTELFTQLWLIQDTHMCDTWYPCDWYRTCTVIQRCEYH